MGPTIVIDVSRRAATSALPAIVLVAVALAVGIPHTARAQDRFRFEVKGVGGFALTPDSPSEFPAGAALRLIVTDNWAIEPEVLYLTQPGEPADYLVDVALQYRRRNYFFSFAVGAYDERLTTYAADDAGIASYWSVSVTVGVGGHLRLWENNAPGARSSALVLTPEVRIGNAPLFRATVSIGYAWD